MDRSLVAFLMHFDLPFRLIGGHAVETEQDSLEDVSNCVEAIVRTAIGQRIELTDFGIADQAFKTQPLPLGEIVNRVIKYEPRASTFLGQHPDELDSLIADVLLRVSIKEVNSA